MNLILACDNQYGIGVQNKLPPWNLKEDIERFKSLTLGDGKNIVIMGKNTYRSLKRPLPNRINVVVSESLYCNNTSKKNNENFISKFGFIICNSFRAALDYAQLIRFINHDHGTIWIIGGAQLYESVLDETTRSLLVGDRILPLEKVYVTKINKTYNCDTFLKEKTISFIENCKWTSIETKNNKDYEYSFCEFLPKKN